MKRFVLSLTAVAVVITAATTMLRSHALWHDRMPSIQELQTGRSDALPEQQIEDRSVVFAREQPEQAKHSTVSP